MEELLSKMIEQNKNIIDLLRSIYNIVFFFAILVVLSLIVSLLRACGIV